MKRKLLLIGAIVAFAVVPAAAQTAADQAEKAKSEGRQYQQDYDDAMNTASGRAGRDEPGAHMMTKEHRPVPEQGVAVDQAGRESNPMRLPNGTTGQRP